MNILFTGVLIVFICCLYLQKRRDSFVDLRSYEDVRGNMVQAEVNAAKVSGPKMSLTDPCVKYTSCKACASVAVCGWCPNTGTCTAVDRWGFPFSAACHPSILALYPDKC